MLNSEIGVGVLGRAQAKTYFGLGIQTQIFSLFGL